VVLQAVNFTGYRLKSRTLVKGQLHERFCRGFSGNDTFARLHILPRWANCSNGLWRADWLDCEFPLQSSGASVKLSRRAHKESDVKIKGTAANCVALASAGFEKPKASALHYRISTVLSKLTTKSAFRGKS